MNAKILGFTLLLLIWRPTNCFSQLYFNLNLGGGICKYNILDNYKGEFYTKDSTYNRYHFIVGFGSSLILNEKFKFGFNFNHSYKKFDFQNSSINPVDFENGKYNSYDLNMLASWRILKLLNLGIMYQFTIMKNLKYTINRVNIININENFYNHLFGYHLSIGYSNFYLSLQYIPHSKIFTTKTLNIRSFPFRNTEIVQVLLSYDFKLFNINWKPITKKLDCPKF
ncbi:MAG: hypothetical protein IPH93_04515 [Saprospiraceae bacterium]|nr:hypothetical protein [Saprospiraceae bacterium]MBK7811765.1 hypothetical protein [Saprospiraceae bacterium]